MQLKNCGTEADYVLPGYTSRLQVLDVGVEKPFKDYMPGYWEEDLIICKSWYLHIPSCNSIAVSKSLS